MISVVIPAYNAEPWLGRAIESVLNQTEPALEIIVVDDGSTDNTKSVAVSYGSKVAYIYQDNAGVSTARNQGVRCSAGDWIAFLDADDYWRADKVVSQIAVLARQPNAIFAYSGFTAVYDDGHEEIFAVCSPEDLLPTLRCRCPFGPSMVLVNRRALLEIGGFDVSLSSPADWELWMRFVQTHGVGAFAYVPESLSYCSIRSDSMSRGTRDALRQSLGIIERRLLFGLTGLNRSMWKRKILARLYRDAAVALREQNESDHFLYMLRSLEQWPFPDSCLPPDRYKIAANMAVKEMTQLLCRYGS
jgi:glycosyltransferase involved in cell wall biosynthesis